MEHTHLTKLSGEPSAHGVVDGLSSMWLSSLLTWWETPAPKGTPPASAPGFWEAQGLPENPEHLGSGSRIGRNANQTTPLPS